MFFSMLFLIFQNQKSTFACIYTFHVHEPKEIDLSYNDMSNADARCYMKFNLLRKNIKPINVQIQSNFSSLTSLMKKVY